jgi:hypothetical protein
VINIAAHSARRRASPDPTDKMCPCGCGEGYSEPADDEPVLDRADLIKGFTKDNTIVVSGLAFKLRHHHGMSFDEVRLRFSRKGGTA